MAIITIRKELKDFLEKEGVLEAFIDNVKRHWKSPNNREELMIKGINMAFVWSWTMSGIVTGKQIGRAHV